MKRNNPLPLVSRLNSKVHPFFLSLPIPLLLTIMTLQGVRTKGKNIFPQGTEPSSLGVTHGPSHFSDGLNRFSLGHRGPSLLHQTLLDPDRGDCAFTPRSVLPYTLRSKGGIQKWVFSAAQEVVSKRCPPYFSWHCGFLFCSLHPGTLFMD